MPLPFIARFILATLLLGIAFYLLKGEELGFSIWSGFGMAFIFVSIATILERIFGGRR